VKRPLVVAHRGASSDVAEHTLAAYVAAIDSGADALECDVRMTSDGHLVCVHDRTVNRTSNGRGRVSTLALSDLAELDFESWRDDWPDSADQLVADEPYLRGVAPDRGPRGGVLALETLLAVVRDTSRDVQLLIETKHPTRYAGLVEQELIRQLDRFGWAAARSGHPPKPNPIGARAAVMSFSRVALRRIRLLAPKLPTVLLLATLFPGRRDGGLPAGINIAGPGLPVLRQHPKYVARAQARGNPVFVWTVDRRSDIEFVLGLGVDAIITNRPADVLRRLRRLA
jgi:glycerophosphoryl diester phosphodiesterase